MSIFDAFGPMRRATEHYETLQRALGFSDRQALLDFLRQYGLAREAKDQQDALLRVPTLAQEYSRIEAERARFKLAATDLAAQAEEIAKLTNERDAAQAECDRIKQQSIAIVRENHDLRPDAVAMRRKRQMDRDRRAGKAVKS